MSNDKDEFAKKMKALAGIQEGDKKYITNEDFSEQDIESPEKDSDFIEIEFDQTDVEPGQDDEKLYKLG
jgi:hypothetical protein